MPLPRRILLILALALAAGVAAVGLAILRRPDIPAAERGRRLAERTGCFGCHGPEGTRGTANPGRKDRSVPTFEGDVMMYAHSADDVRAWIRTGRTPKRARSRTWLEERKRGTLRMPAFGRRLSPRQIEDLTAFVEARAGEPEPQDSLASAGLQRAEDLGCAGCHGPGGRFARPNPGSFKGVVPAWDSRDFADLVRDRAEFDAWVRHGMSPRFRRNPAARFFLERAVLHMPAFEGHLEPGDLDALWAWITWLRTEGARPS